MGLFGSIKTAIFGGPKKRGKVDQKGTTNYDPWEVAIPSITNYMNDTNSLYQGTPIISDYEQRGYDMLEDTVNAGAGDMDAAIAENNKTLSGAYLDPSTNPYIKDIADRMGKLASTTALSSFGGRGRTGSGLAGYYSGKGAADATGEVYFNNYNNERGRMGSAVGMAPVLAQGRYLGPQALISAGQNISARPFDVNAKRGEIMMGLGGLGQQGVTTGKSTQTGYTGGLIGKIADSFTNKLFG
jgi:hypothetical protein